MWLLQMSTNVMKARICVTGSTETASTPLEVTDARATTGSKETMIAKVEDDSWSITKHYASYVEQLYQL